MKVYYITDSKWIERVSRYGKAYGGGGFNNFCKYLDGRSIDLPKVGESVSFRMGRYKVELKTVEDLLESP